MSPNRPITMSLPLGLFSAATLSAPLPRSSKADTTLFLLDRKLLDMPTVTPDSDDSKEELTWED
jgi:hypothetical protein